MGHPLRKTRYSLLFSKNLLYPVFSLYSSWLVKGYLSDFLLLLGFFFLLGLNPVDLFNYFVKLFHIICIELVTCSPMFSMCTYFNYSS